MISDARGGHVSPGVYTEVRDVTYSTKSLGITTLGVAGETLKGPAFQPISIASWTDFTDYFGGTSPIKFKGTNYPKYELPYIAKAYLEESKQLEVVRVLGLSGYWAGKAWVITISETTGGTGEMPVVILRSKKEKNVSEGTTGACEEYKDVWGEVVETITLDGYESKSYGAHCEETPGESEIVAALCSASTNEDGTSLYLGKFSLTIKTKEGSSYNGATYKYNVSMDHSDPDYLYKIFQEDPLMGSAPVYIEAVYDMALEKNLIDALNEAGTGETSVTKYYNLDPEGSKHYYDFISPYRCAVTPWIVSEVKAATTEDINVKKLFKVYTISDGNAANYQVKISIQRIRPIEGLFDLVVRDFYDTDNSPMVLEKFTNISMVEGESNFIGLKIGTIDGTYPNKSKYIAIELSDEEGIDDAVPCGFLGYPIPDYGTDNGVSINYNSFYNSYVKPKRQYFGLNDEVLDYDILNYKGVSAYTDGNGDATPDILTHGFHLDAIFKSGDYKKENIFVDGVSGFVFDCVDPIQSVSYDRIPRIIPNDDYLNQCLYKDINLRKFTVYPYGGFDGWDINESARTNTDNYRGNKYTIGATGSSFENTEIFRRIGGVNSGYTIDPMVSLKLPNIAISTDYYAYLAGYMQFANPEDVDINLFATPGINWYDQTLLSEDALDIIEDSEDGRGGDALYVMAAPQYNEAMESYSPDEVADSLNDTELDSPYACTYYPWVKYWDGDNKRYIDLPATKDVVRDMAATDNVSFPWFSPAGLTRGEVECARAYYKTTLLDEDTLYENMINPIKTFAVDGVKVWGNKTLYHQETPRNRINVSRLMIRVKKLVSQAARQLIFEQYDATLEKQFRSIVEPILQDVKANRGIYDYRVVTESTEETRDQHILPAKILIKPTPALEYISISFVVYPESVQFDESL